MSHLCCVACKWCLGACWEANVRAKPLSGCHGSACGSDATRGKRFLRPRNASGDHRKPFCKRLGELLRVFPALRRGVGSILPCLVMFFGKDLCIYCTLFVILKPFAGRLFRNVFHKDIGIFCTITVVFENIRWTVWVVVKALAGAFSSFARA